MLKEIKISPKQFRRYKQNSFIDPGEYYTIDNRLNQDQKNILKPIAAQDRNGGFHWLLEKELWIKRLIEGDKIQKLNKSITDNDLNSFFSFNISNCREWQKRVLMDVYEQLIIKSSYKRGIIAPLGAGKTLLGLILGNLSFKTLVVAPRNIHEGWQSEALKWKTNIPRVVTYESAWKVNFEPEILILDEVLKVKNSKALRTQYIQKINSLITIGFTGTPTGAREALDLQWINTIIKTALPAREYQFKYLFGVNPRLEYNEGADRNTLVIDSWNQDKISKFTANYIHNIDIKEIAKELPEREYIIYTVPFPKEFQSISKGMYAQNNSKALSQLRQCSDGFLYTVQKGALKLNTEKIKQIIDIIENNTGESFVIYANWDYSVKALKEALINYSPSVLAGDTKDMNSEISRFKQGKTKILIANSRISEGMNLQENCRIMIFMSNSLNPIDREQAEGRIYRPGQKRGVKIIDIFGSPLDKRQLEVLKKYKNFSSNYIEKLLMEEFLNGNK
jgi:superfamily II DNA or RNA helicase